MTWSECFTAYITKRFGEGAQQKAARSLDVPQSSVHYWCHGQTPRAKTRRKIDRWSGGDVPAALEVAARPSSGDVAKAV